MGFAGQTVVVTGGARGIGAAIAHAFTTEGAKVWVLDMNTPNPRGSGRFLACDVSDPVALSGALKTIRDTSGYVDVYVSNAGVMSETKPDNALGSVEDWSRCWSVNVMAHVHAAQAILPDMVKRGEGHFVIVASAAGLLYQIGDAAYSATKHAAVNFAEALAIEHGDDGISVSLVCPQYVATPLIGLGAAEAKTYDGLLSADEIAETVLNSVEKGVFRILPHPDVQTYAEQRAADHDRWIAGMRNLRRRAFDKFGRISPQDFYKLV